MNIEIANRLVDLRKKSGLSQEELAAKLGLSRQAVSKWERAEASPDTDNLICLAKLYGVSLDDLLDTDQSIDDIVEEQVKPAEEEKKEAEEAKTQEAPKTEEGPKAEEAPRMDASAKGDDSAKSENASTANDQGKKKANESFTMGSDGIHFKDNDDEGYIDNTGVHVFSKDGSEVHVSANGIHINDGGEGVHVNMEEPYKFTYKSHRKGWALAESLVASITSLLALTAYLCLGLLYPDHYIGWGVCWLVLFLIPIATSFVSALRHHKFCNFAIPVVVVGIYVMLGMVFGLWGTTWPIFFAIPLYYVIFDPIDHVIRDHLHEKRAFTINGKAVFDDDDDDDDEDEKKRDDDVIDAEEDKK
jgi:transcriptional regulator with XRE-family HTH domain